MTAAASLTKGAIAALITKDDIGDVKPLLQIYDVRAVSSQRYLMRLSDGVHFLQVGEVCKRMKALVRTGQLQNGSIVMLNKFVSQIAFGRRTIILTDMDVVVTKCDIDGEPKYYWSDAASINQVSLQIQSNIGKQQATAAAYNPMVVSMHRLQEICMPYLVKDCAKSKSCFRATANERRRNSGNQR